METKTRKRIGPPLLLAAVVEALIPAASRGEEGDWHEEYVSPRQYVRKAAGMIPPMIALQVGRTFNRTFVAGEAVILFFSFAGAPLLPLAIIIAVALGVLILRDAYIHPNRRCHLDAVPHAIVASTFVFISQIVLGIIAPSLTAPYGTTIRGASISLMLMSAWRLVFSLNKRPELPPAITHAYQTTWRMNILWMIASLGLTHSNVLAVPAIFEGRDFLLGAIPVMALGIAYRLQMDVPGRVAREVAPLSVFHDPRQNELAIKQLKLLAPYKTPDSVAVWVVCFEVLFFVCLAWPLGSAFWRWFTDAPSVALVDWPQVWTNLGALLPLSGAWVYVKTLNRKTALQIQEEIDALNAEEKK